MAKTQDKYANMLVKQMTMSAANTLTFDEIDIGLSLFDKVGLKVQRLEYHWGNAALEEMTAANDAVQAGLFTSNAPATMDPGDVSTIHMAKIKRLDQGTAAASRILELPFVFNFAELDGGGLLITPKPLYIGMFTTGLASAGTITLRVFFTVVKLTPPEYFELLETRHYFGQ